MFRLSSQRRAGSPRRALIPLTILAALLLPASAQALVVGVTDQKPETFYDERYRELGLTDSRLVVPWDWSRYRWQIKEIDSWMDAADRAGVTDILVAFDRSRVRRDETPTRAEYLRHFKKFRNRYPQVREYAAWNEPNLHHQPVAKKVELVARFYRGVKANCRGCTVLASELIDTPSMERWAKDFQREIGGPPEIWGLHNYRDTNRRETDETRALLRVSKRSEIWITETGGIVGRERGARAGDFPQTPNNAAKAIRFLFRAMPGLSNRVERIYVYHWQAEKGPQWDSGLIDADGDERPAYDAFIRELKRLGVGSFR
jgi:hypothetical protein